jgi:diacylglycerol kinase family enzyme
VGTRNHFAKDVGLENDVPKAVAVIAAGGQKTVDVGEINGHPFLNNCSLGIYPSIVEVRDSFRARGHRKWVAFILATRSMVRRHRRAVVRLEADGRSSIWRTAFVMVGNNAYDRTGLRFTGRSHLDRAELCAYLAPDVRARELPRAVLVKALRRLVGRPDSPSDPFHVVRARELWIEGKEHVPLSIAIDGEVVPSVPPLHLRSRPGALRVFAPVD